jgi:hypothetical protein
VSISYLDTHLEIDKLQSFESETLQERRFQLILLRTFHIYILYMYTASFKQHLHMVFQILCFLSIVPGKRVAGNKEAVKPMIHSGYVEVIT